MSSDRRSVWDLSMIRVESDLNKTQRQANNYSVHNKIPCLQFCSKPVLVGLLIGMLVAGNIFAALLTLLLLKEDSNKGCVTTLITVSSATTTMTVRTESTTSVLNVNLLVNGDAETGPCAIDGNVTSVTGWTFSGPVSQIPYNNTVISDQNSTTPGPSNRGRCYFHGQISATTSMWQTIDLTDRIDSLLINSQTVRYNLSAWIGGLSDQDDHAIVSITFIDSNNQLVNSNNTSIGPVLANDRANRTSLLFQQTNGYVPATTRSILVLVTINRQSGTINSGSVDNIGFMLY